MTPIINTTMNILMALSVKADKWLEDNLYKMKFSDNIRFVYNNWTNIKKEYYDFQARVKKLEVKREWIVDFINDVDPVKYCKERLENMDYWLNEDLEDQQRAKEREEDDAI